MNCKARFSHAEEYETGYWNLWCDVSLDGGETWHEAAYGCCLVYGTRPAGFYRNAVSVDEWHTDELFGPLGEDGRATDEQLDLAAELDAACEAACTEWQATI